MTPQEDIARFMDQAFPRSQTRIVDARLNTATLKRRITPEDTRPGGTVSGPTMMALADMALYVAIHSTLGLTPGAVTTSLNTNFLRRPSADKDIVAVCKLLKVGRSLVVGEVSIFSEGSDEPLAHVVGTYSIPPPGRAG